MERFWHSRTAYLGCWLYLYLVILDTDSGPARLFLAVHVIACVLARARLRETTDRPSHVHYQRFLTCPQVLTILRFLPHLEKFWKLPELFGIHKMENIELISLNILFVFFTNVTLVMRVLIYMLNLETQF